MPYFVVGKLVRFFVFDEPHPSRAMLEPLAVEFRENGSEVGPIVERIISSNLFYSQHAIARKIRSPIELAIGMLRSLGGTTNTIRLAESLAQLGQGLFYPPNVKGWDGGRAWINSSTLLGRANLVRQLLDHESTRFEAGSLQDYVRSHALKSPEEIVRWFSDLLFATPLTEVLQSNLVDLLGAPNDAAAPTESDLRDLIHALSTLPEFQLG
jgi:uncharacterized protein (DUF1800 family)